MATKHYKVIENNTSLLSELKALTWQRDSQQRRGGGLPLESRKHMRGLYLASSRRMAFIWLELNF